MSRPICRDGWTFLGTEQNRDSSVIRRVELYGMTNCRLLSGKVLNRRGCLGEVAIAFYQVEITHSPSSGKRLLFEDVFTRLQQR